MRFAASRTFARLPSSAAGVASGSIFRRGRHFHRRTLLLGLGRSQGRLSVLRMAVILGASAVLGSGASITCTKPARAMSRASLRARRPLLGVRFVGEGHLEVGLELVVQVHGQRGELGLLERLEGLERRRQMVAVRMARPPFARAATFNPATRWCFSAASFGVSPRPTIHNAARPLSSRLPGSPDRHGRRRCDRPGRRTTAALVR